MPPKNDRDRAAHSYSYNYSLPDGMDVGTTEPMAQRKRAATTWAACKAALKDWPALGLLALGDK